MSLSAHTITARQLGAIAEGTSGPDHLGILISGQRSKCLAMIALVVQLAASTRHPEAAATADGASLLARVQRLAPRAAEEILRYPTVTSWAAIAALGLSSPPTTGMSPGHLALIAVAAAIRGNIPCSIELPPSACAGITLELPSLGSLLLPEWLRGEAVRICHQDGLTEIRGPQASVLLPTQLDSDLPTWRALPVLTVGKGAAQITMRLDDGEACHFTGCPADLISAAAIGADAWHRRLGGAWELLTHDHSAVANEIAALIVVMTPLRSVQGRLLSATSRRAFGSVAMSLPDSDVAMALALAHEVQHVKLSALMDLLPMVTDRASGLYYAPWRDDPRPLVSLLQGMYAHLGVARFWRRHRQVVREPAEVHHAHVEFARWRQACNQVPELLSARAELTRCGGLFVAGMERRLQGWTHDYVPVRALVQAHQLTAEHRERWVRQHGDAPSPPVPA